MAQRPTGDNVWHTFLSGEHPMLRRYFRLLRMLPSDPRCRFCGAPFGGLGGRLMRLMGKGRSNLNPHWCNACETLAKKQPGGTEIEITMFFVDVRGSTGLAEGMRPLEFTELMNRFYAVATDILSRTDAMIDKMVGDEVIGLYIPGFTGPKHAQLAIQAAQELLLATGHRDPGGPWLPVGIGIHTGIVYVGVIGAEGITDITAMGDAMNTTARLVSQAGSGEAVISEVTCIASGLNLGDLEQRHLALKGRQEEVDVRVLHSGPKVSPKT